MTIEKQIADHSQQILSMKSLKTLKIVILKSILKTDQSKALKFYSEVVKSKHLEHVHLNIKNQTYKSSLLVSLLLEISQTSLPAFYIALSSIYHSENYQSLGAAISNADLFLLSFSRFSNSANFACNTVPKENSPLDQIKRTLELDLVTDVAFQGFPLKPGEQENLLIKDLNSSFIPLFSFFRPIIPNLNNIARLKKLCLSFYSGPHGGFASLGRGLAKVLTHASSLEHLTLNSKALKKRSEPKAELELYEPIFIETKNLKNLTNLEFSLQTLSKEVLDALNLALIHLENLRRFVFHYGSAPNLEEFLLTFPEQNKLTEFDIHIHPLNTESKINFVKMLGKLGDLRKLKAFGGVQLFRDEKSKSLIMKTLLGLTKLREISLENRAPVLPGSNDQQEIAGLIAELGGYTEKLFRENQDLEKVYAKLDKSYEIKYIRY